MDHNKFWDIIEVARLCTYPGEKRFFLQTIRQELALLSPGEVIVWYNIKNFYLKLADKKELWDVATKYGLYMSDDKFLYFREWLLTRGKDVFYDALTDPTSVLKYVKFAKNDDVQCEELTSICSEIFYWSCFKGLWDVEDLKKHRNTWLLEHKNSGQTAFCHDLQYGTYDLFRYAKSRPLDEEVQSQILQNVVAYGEKKCAAEDQKDGFLEISGTAQIRTKSLQDMIDEVALSLKIRGMTDIKMEVLSMDESDEDDNNWFYGIKYVLAFSGKIDHSMVDILKELTQDTEVKYVFVEQA